MSSKYFLCEQIVDSIESEHLDSWFSAATRNIKVPKQNIWETYPANEIDSLWIFCLLWQKSVGKLEKFRFDSIMLQGLLFLCPLSGIKHIEMAWKIVRNGVRSFRAFLQTRS